MTLTTVDIDASDFALVRQGNVDAFERIFRRHHAALCDAVDRHVHDQDVAEEIVQDLFFAVWRARATLAIRTTLAAYLFTAGRNRALHHLRHARVVQQWATRAEFEVDVGAGPRTAPPADRLAQDNETRERWRHAVAQLPPRTRLAAILRWEQEMTHAEIAAAMQISAKGAEKLIANARRRLRPVLDDSTPSAADERSDGTRGSG